MKKTARRHAQRSIIEVKLNLHVLEERQVTIPFLQELRLRERFPGKNPVFRLGGDRRHLFLVERVILDSPVHELDFHRLETFAIVHHDGIDMADTFEARIRPEGHFSPILVLGYVYDSLVGFRSESSDGDEKSEDDDFFHLLIPFCYVHNIENSANLVKKII
jgi:hypothetical protein